MTPPPESTPFPAEPGLASLLWCDRLFAELAALGVDAVFAAPGSRSTPLMLAAARQPSVSVRGHFDERALGFLALGHARATRRPAVIITTSGTAVANLLPAVVEAAQDHVPMLLLTADRPAELRGTGANQTIDQVHIFGAYARSFFDVPCPEDQRGLEDAAELARQAVSRAEGGPVHLNLAFREPLQPDALPPPPPPVRQDCDCPPGGLLASYPPDCLQPCLERLRAARRVWLLAGSGLHPFEKAVLLEIARQHGWTVIPDVLSGLRLEDCPGYPVAHHADLALLRPLGADAQPDFVLHVGGRMVSKRLAQALAGAGEGRLWHLHPHPDRIEVVPGRVTPLRGGAMALTELREQGLPVLKADPFLARCERVARALDEVFASDDRLTEPAVLREVTRLVPGRSGLFLGSSMPVRDAEMFGAVREDTAQTAGNRGASGIDGTLASAAGFALGLDRAATVVLGDLAALHDLNSLAFIAAQRLPLVIVVINNHGGGIFHFLPAHGLEAAAGAWWTTPHGWGFESAARMFGLEYRRPASRTAFRADYAAAAAAGRPCLIEVVTGRVENVAVHRELQDRVRRALEAP